MKIGICLQLAAAAMLLPAARTQVSVSSPNGGVEFRLSASQGGALEYAVNFKGKPAIKESRVAITVNGVNLALGARLDTVERYEVNEKYPWFGGRSEAVDKCNGARVSVAGASGKPSYTLEIRAYDDGVAFRHLVPGEGVRTPDEATSFHVPQNSVLWFHDLEDHYEAQHVRKGLRAIPNGAWMAPPVTIQLPEGLGYAAITEGALRNYSGMALQADGEGSLWTRLGHATPPSYPFRLRYADDVERLKKPAVVEGPITTPWRILMLGADWNTLVNSDIVHNVAPKPDARLFPLAIRTEWIKPGRALWSYLDGGTNTLEGMKEFSRQAGELGFEYSVLEGFWARWPEKDVKELVDDSRKLGVGILLWRHSNQLRTPEARRSFFEMCKRTGVVGAKIDFFDHEHKEVVDLYEILLREAAEARLLVDFHGCNKATGMERTWPNMIGLEGIRGMEMRPPYAQHDVTLPFTRMLAGLADYTPMHFGARKFADTTWSHQIANAVLLQAPLQVYAANPYSILNNPAVAVIKSIPSTWDETVVLPVSSIGEVVAFARRKGKTWFLAVNNGVIERAVTVDLSFLGAGWYQGALVRDGSEAASVSIEHGMFRASDSLTIRMRSGGGFVGHFRQ
jgi:alpha-glucosidase